MLRGMRTLAVRIRHHQESGNAVAAWLEQHPKVERVFHPGLPSFDQRALFCKQMKGSGGLLTFMPKNQDKDAVIRFVEELSIFQIGVSWGGFESLSVPICMKPLGWTDEAFVIRLYCGLEDPQDLIKDLDQALSRM